MRYRHLVVYWETMSNIACSLSAEDAMRARSSAYLGAPQYTLPIFHHAFLEPNRRKDLLMVGVWEIDGASCVREV